jgi:hypothetical protein
MGDAIGRVRRRQQGGRAQARALDGVIAEMLVEPRPPHRGDAVAGLQQRPHPLARAAAHQARCGHDSRSRARRWRMIRPCRRTPSTMPFVGPFHEPEFTGFRRQIGWAKRSVPTNDQQLCRSAWWARRKARSLPMPRTLTASNHPDRIAGEEKYSPAAVSAQEITSMPLSNSSPFRRISLHRRNHRQHQGAASTISAASSCELGREPDEVDQSRSGRPPSRSPTLIICSVMWPSACGPETPPTPHPASATDTAEPQTTARSSGTVIGPVLRYCLIAA